MDNYWNIEIETFGDRFNNKFVFISSDGSSGCKYAYTTIDELKEIVSNYINNMLKENKNG